MKITFKRHYLFYLVSLYIIWVGSGNIDFDYGVYQILRFIVFFAFGFATFVSYSSKQQIMPFVLGFIAILFNPFVPITLERDTWQWIDVFVGIGLTSWAIYNYNPVFVGRLKFILKGRVDSLDHKIKRISVVSKSNKRRSFILILNIFLFFGLLFLLSLFIR